MAELGQLAIETIDLATFADKRVRRGLALTMLRPDTDAKVIKVKMASICTKRWPEQRTRCRRYGLGLFW